MDANDVVFLVLKDEFEATLSRRLYVGNLRTRLGDHVETSRIHDEALAPTLARERTRSAKCANVRGIRQ